MNNLPNELFQLIISHLAEMTKFNLYKTSHLLTIQRINNPLRVINKKHKNYNLVKCDSVIIHAKSLKMLADVLPCPIAKIIYQNYVQISHYYDIVEKLSIINNDIYVRTLPKYLKYLSIRTNQYIKQLCVFPETLTHLIIKAQKCPELFLPNSLKYLNVENCPKIHYPDNLKVLIYSNCPIDNLPKSLHTIYFPDQFINTGLNLKKIAHFGIATYPETIQNLIILDEIHNLNLPPQIIKLKINSNSTFNIPSLLKKLTLLHCSDNYFRIFDIECVIYYSMNELNKQYIEHYNIFEGNGNLRYLRVINGDVKKCNISTNSKITIREGIEDLLLTLSTSIKIPNSVKNLSLRFVPHPNDFIYSIEVKLPKQLKNITTERYHHCLIKFTVIPSDLLTYNTCSTDTILPARFITIPSQI